ncbi:MAG: hypothetical protein O2904_00230 [bacterium]|nr:hypothetical protein [bacterium]
MADDPATTMAQSGLVISDDVRTKYPDLLELILGSESMNDEERQYWLNILPIMTPDQVENLRGILSNEKQQLAAIDNKYSKEIEEIGQEELVKKTGMERLQRRTARQAQEAEAEVGESEMTDDLLKQIENT